MASYSGSSVLLKEERAGPPVEVLCEVCIGPRLRAVKSCFTCQTSYCHTHLEPHQRVPGLKKHQLVDPMEGLEDRLCKKHDRLLELFCQNEQVCVCQFCKEGDHKSHRVVPLEQEYEEKTAKWQKMEAEVQQMIREGRQKIQEIRDTVKLCKADADREIANGVKVFTALKTRIQTCQDELNRTVTEKLKSTEEQAEGLIKELEQEIKDLMNRSAEMRQVPHIEDHLQFLQTFKPLKVHQHTRAWKTAKIHPQDYAGTLRRSLEQLEATLKMEKKTLCDLSSVEPHGGCRKGTGLQMYACKLTLDHNTAHTDLSLSEDQRKVLKKQSCLPQPERFDSWPQVLCREALTGRCYWEVERGGYVCVGVTYRGITRRGGGPDSRLGWNNKSWSLDCFCDGGYTARHNGNETILHLPPAGSKRVGVYLDRPAGTLSFYRVTPGVGGSSDTLTHIHTFRSTFTQGLYPGFGLGTSSSVSLF